MPIKFMDYIYSELFPKLEEVMLGISYGSEPHRSLGLGNNLAKIDVGSVAEELKTFGKECTCV